MKKILLLIVFLLITPLSAVPDVKIRTGIYNNNPKVFVDASGMPAGFFIDITNEIAQQNNFRIEYINGEWADNIRKLERGELDMLLDVSYTAERTQKFRLNKRFIIESWIQAFSKPSGRIYRIEELDGKRIAVIENSIQEQYLKNELTVS